MGFAALGVSGGGSRCLCPGTSRSRPRPRDLRRISCRCGHRSRTRRVRPKGGSADRSSGACLVERHRRTGILVSRCRPAPAPVARMGPPYPGCQAPVAIEQAIREALDSSGYGDVHIEGVLSPPWTTEWITPRGRERLKAYGIAPPDPSATAQCPQCGSTDTVEVSRFGSTPCKAQWRCKSCLEPFDRFKCH